MHDDAVHEVSKAPGTELSGTGTMVVAVVKCKLVELCLTSDWEAETSRTVVVNKANALHCVAPRRAARYNQLPQAMNNVAQGAM